MSAPVADRDAGALGQLVGLLLRAGVLLAGALVLAGGLILLWQHGLDRPDYHVFHGEPKELWSIGAVLAEALAHQSRALIQLGLLVLIATPVARVALAAAAFLWQRDGLYLIIALTVLGVLLGSLTGRL